MAKRIDTDKVETATYTVPQAAKVLGISRAQAYVSVADGDIPTFRIGGRILTSRRKIHAMIDGE